MRRRPDRSRFERMLFSVMGPPQLGDVNAPIPTPTDGPAELCPRCGGPRDEHEVVRSPRLTYTRCPGAQPP